MELPLPATDTLPAGTRDEVAAARLQLLGDARHRVAMRLPVLSSEGYASIKELDELRRIATSGRSALIRILLHDPQATLRNDHRLIALAQRLPSSIQIRVPVDEVDLTWASACLLNDVGGYLFLPEAERPRGRAARSHRANAVPLQQHFDEVWDRSEYASMLHTLDI
ncbi:MAG: hypothetical protein EPN69_12490 [Rhodanobacter sp.]|nr:MAG: hypothetical protein EPN69_12490 [Rhodanobacter sp.]TAL91674.1 MAG: hypothetical protein EPN71_11995 [Rhodanobacter sp.]TAM38953.1 MAG: hypothetical protein EPN58_15240 [Rhodanobacter sp.]